MFGAIQISSVKQFVSGFFGVSHHFLNRRIGSDKLAEVIVSTVVCFLAEFNFTLHHSYFIFILHCFLVSHLKNNVSLTQRQVYQFVHTCAVNSRNKFQVVTVNLCTFVLCSSHPVGITGLTVFLSKLYEVSTTFDSIVDTVGQSFRLSCICCIYLNLTELNRIGSRSLGYNFE